MRTLLLFVFLTFVLALNAQAPSFVNQGKTWAVVVGVSDYQDKEISDLLYAHEDAKAFYDFLQSPAGGNIPAEQIKVLLNKDATTANIDNAFGWLIEAAGAGDQVLIYFSGHGDVETRTFQNHGFLLTYDSPSKSYVAGAYPLFFLQSVISTLSQKNGAKVIMIADACRSGALAGMSINGPQATAQYLQQQFANEIKILACGPTEYSVEGKQWGGGHGAFTYNLLEGLTGLADKDGNYEINLFEIRRYLEDKVPAETAPNSQIPMTIGANARITYVDPSTMQALQMKKASESPTIAMVGSKGVIPQNDSLAKLWYKGFEDALAQKHLLEPTDSSAYHYFQLLLQKQELATLHNLMRRNLATALQDDAQQAINAYLKTAPEEMARRWRGNSPYRHIPTYLEKSIELLGQEHYMYKTLKAKQLYFEGLILRMDGEMQESKELFQKALQKLEEALQYEQRGAYLFNELGMIQGALEQVEKEIASYHKAIELSPTWAMPFNNLGSQYEKQNQLDTAKYYFEQTIALQPDLAIAYYNLGTVLMQQEQLEEAKKNLQKAIELDSLLDIAYHNLGSILYSEEKYTSAQPILEKLIKVNPQFADGYYLLASTFLATDQYQKAEQMYKEALRLNPEHPYIHFGLGMSYENLGQFDKAIAAYQKNLEITPAWTYPNYSISICFAEKGAQEEALIWLEKSLELELVTLEELEKERAFDSIRQSDIFKQLITKYFP
ncbi:MAG: tetratricopeptide repeat protein [Saprospiraceae bacterium]|nr:tetratricopeptide repeat protein [Saprospiraceae bacterium]